MSNKFSKKKLQQQMALIGFLGISTLIFQNQAYARGSVFTDIDSEIKLNNGEIIHADTVFAGIGYEYNYLGRITGVGDGIAGVYNQKGKTADINLGAGSEINTTSGGVDAFGIYIEGDRTRLTSDALKIVVNASAAVGAVHAVKVLADDAYINLGSGSQILIDKKSGYATGISVESKASVFADAINIQRTWDYGTGIYSPLLIEVRGGGFVDLGRGSTVNGSIGVSGQNSLFKADHLKSPRFGVDKEGTIEVGMGSQTEYLAAGSGGVIIFKGSESERNQIAGIDQGFGRVFVDRGGVIYLDYTDISAIKKTGGFTDPTLNAHDDGVLYASNISIIGYGSDFFTDIHHALVHSVGASASVYLSGENKFDAVYPSNAIMGTRDGFIYGIGKMNMVGSVLAGSYGFSDYEYYGVIDLSLTDGSSWYGMAGKYTDPNQKAKTKEGIINLSLSGSYWKMSADSTVNKLVLNNSTIEFVENKLGSVLRVDDLSGSGNFVMHVDFVSDSGTNSGDKLIVKNSSAGQHTIQMQNQGHLTTTGEEVLTVVETPDGIATFSLPNAKQKIELGGYVYGIRKNSNGKDWELYSFFQEASEDSKGGGEISAAADVSASFLNVGYLLNYAETQTLLQRMGELRQNNHEGDVWTRVYSGKFDSFGGDKLSGFSMDYTGVQAGVDRYLNLNKGGLYLGVMGGVSQADPHYISGDGDVSAYHLGVYGTYVAENDFYIDAIAKYNHLKNKFSNVLDTQGNQINGEATSDGYGLSLEVGKRFYWDASHAGYYLEPQAQLSYSYQGSASTRASNGLVTEMDDYYSTIGRISAIVGYELSKGIHPMNVYLKTGYVTEMGGNVQYKLNGHQENNDFGGDWWESGIGLTAQINQKHNVYLEGQYATGRKFNQTQVNAGYRYSF